MEGVPNVEHAARWLLARGREIERDLRSVDAFLESLQEWKDFDSCLRVLERLQNDESIRPTLLQSVPLGEWLESAAGRKREIESLSAGKVHYFGLKGRLLPLTAASDLAGVAVHRARRLVVQGRLRPADVVIRSTGRRVELFDAEELALRCDTRRAGRVGSRPEVILGLDRRCVKGIRMAGLVPARVARGQHYPEELQLARIAEVLQANAKDKPPGLPTVCLGEPTVWHGHMWRAMAEVVRDGAVGKMPIFASQQGHGWGRLHVPAALIGRVRRLCTALRYRELDDPRQQLLFPALPQAPHTQKIESSSWQVVRAWVVGACGSAA